MKYQKELLSVIIPVYNSKKYLIRCIESLIKQSYHNIEIILVDDGSTDGSSVLCNELKEKDNRIKVFHQKNLGPGAARNVGLKNAKGEYITFVDSDDSVEIDAYERMLSKKNKSADVIIGQWYTILENKKIKNNNRLYTSTKVSKNNIIKGIIKYDEKYGGGYPWNKIINWKQIIKKAGNNILFNENLNVYEDKCWVLDILKYAEKIVITDVYMYNYYYYYHSLSHSLLGTIHRIEAISLALEHIKYTYKDTVFEKYIDIEIESNKLNNIWYRVKYGNNEVDLNKLWKDFKINKMHSFFDYSSIIKVKYLLLSIKMMI